MLLQTHWSGSSASSSGGSCCWASVPPSAQHRSVAPTFKVCRSALKLKLAEVYVVQKVINKLITDEDRHIFIVLISALKLTAQFQLKPRKIQLNEKDKKVNSENSFPTHSCSVEKSWTSWTQKEGRALRTQFSRTTVLSWSSSLVLIVAMAPSLNSKEVPPSTTMQASQHRERTHTLRRHRTPRQNRASYWSGPSGSHWLAGEAPLPAAGENPVHDGLPDAEEEAAVVWTEDQRLVVLVCDWASQTTVREGSDMEPEDGQNSPLSMNSGLRGTSTPACDLPENKHNNIRVLMSRNPLVTLY